MTTRPTAFSPLSEQQPAEIRPTSTEVAWPVTAGLGVRVLNIVTNMESRFPAMLVLWLGREFYRGSLGFFTIVSHVNLKYNNIADNLAKEGTTMPQAYVPLTYLDIPSTYIELYSRTKTLVNISWRHPPAHSWYRSEGPGAAIRFKGNRKDQTALARLLFGHLKTLRFSRGDKNICTKCNMIEATPQHLLDCVAVLYDNLLKRSYFVLEVMEANDLMDLI
ncbi:hypothetical protein AVEN_101535-1 [Araneus ventricosus]|uniref:RNase H type-1 domain-containing protein n=1 Tax=Araneus ventricosus TaxID=182803 RepID=A0A4Y2GRT2_ARAVE|nr:hypothetical protein AVEN_101535-1 [Araneus ventricosus]